MKLKSLLVCLIASTVLASANLWPSISNAQSISVPAPNDCDANAVIYCGANSVSSLIQKYDNGDGRNSASSIHDIFSYFGVSSADVHAMNDSSSDVVAGKVTRSGNVYDDSGKIIATGAMTGGRQDMPGSTRVSSGGTTFYSRPPSSSFQSYSLAAFVVMKNGSFDFAVIASCGNVVKATAKTQAVPKKPNLSINKTVAVKGDPNFTKSVTVQTGAHVVFQVEVKSTGDTSLENLIVKDQMPANMAFVDGTLTHNGKPSAGQTPFFREGVTMPSLSTTTTYTFETIVGINDKPDQCSAETLTNVASAESTNVPGQQSSATVNKTCAPPPSIPPPPPPPPPPAPPTVTTTSSAPPQQPTALINVGPGSMAGIFLIAAGVGYAGYRYYLGKVLQIK